MKLVFALALMGSFTAVAEMPGGKFWFPFPNFTGGPGVLTHEEFVKVFDGAHHHPGAYNTWINSPFGNKDIRLLNPKGIYQKHLNFRTVEPPTSSAYTVGDHPNYEYVAKNGWILKDANGNPISLFGWGELVDFENDAYLDYVLNEWFPRDYFDSTDRDENRETWVTHDNGNFNRMYLNCAPGDQVCNKYNSDEGVRNAWVHVIRRFKERFPNKKIAISSGTNTHQSEKDQLLALTTVFAEADGYYSESITSDQVYWKDIKDNNAKRVALITQMKFVKWLADNDKYYMPRLGDGPGPQPTQSEIDYAYAYFNLMRRGDKQLFGLATKDSNGAWVPKIYPEMNLALGSAKDAEAVEFKAAVFKREFVNAIAFVNLSDTQQAIELPAGRVFKNSLGQVVESPLRLSSFSGLTIYSNPLSAPEPQPEPQPLPAPKPAPVTPAAPRAAWISESTGNSLSVGFFSAGANLSYLVSAATQNAKCESGIETKNLEASIKNLQANTSYSIAICSKASNGLLSTPLVISGKTLTAPAPKAPVKLPPPPATKAAWVEEETRTSISLAWTSAAPKLSYVIAAGLGSQVPSCNGGLVVNGLKGTIRGLQPAKPYTLVVCSRASDGQISSPYIIYGKGTR